MKVAFSALGALLLTTGLVSPAAADIVQVSASSIQGNNVLFNQGGQQNANIVNGLLNNDASTQVDFQGSNGAILRASRGQASITGALDPSTNNPNDTIALNGFTFDLADGSTFNNAEFNLFGGSATGVNFTLTDNAGDLFNFSNALGNGSNRFGFQAIAGQSIRNITFATVGGGIQDVRQVRVGMTATPVGPDAVPEPATWAMMLGGFGILGGAMRRRNRATYVTA